ncbi:hypothetical protein GF395_02595 [Candidatus Uhrbacteria bacterium]|nr:hypothetical protein [Candidatus Uhrbacteria bacterium]
MPNVQERSHQQMNETPNPYEENAPTEDLTIRAQKPTSPNLSSLAATDPLCSTEPEYTPIGSYNYPRDHRYGDLAFLGEFFTAYRCGAGQTEKLFTVQDGTYIFGSVIKLTTPPDDDFLNALHWIGYTCNEVKAAEECQRWELTEHVPVDRLIYLESWHPYIAVDDCVHCG